MAEEKMREKNYGKDTSRPMRGPGNGPPGMVAGAKARDFKGTLKKLARYLKIYLPRLIVVVLLSIAATGLSLGAPKIMGNATNEMMVGYIAKNAIGALTELESDPAMLTLMRQNGITPLSECADNAAKAETVQKLIEWQQAADTGEGTSVLPASYSNYLPRIAANVAKTGGGIDFAALGKTALTLLFLYVGSAVCSFVEIWLMVGITQALTFRMRSDINAKLTRLPLKYFDSQTHGEILSRVTNDVDTVSFSLQQSLSQIISSVIMVIGILIMMLTISGVMTLITLAFLPLSLGFTFLITRKSQKFFRGQQKSLGQLNGHVEEMYGCHGVVKAYNYEQTSIEEFERTNTDLYDNAWKAQFMSGTMQPIIGFIGNLAYVGVCVSGGYIAAGGKMLVGSIQSFIQYSRQFNQPISQVAQIVNIMQSTIAAAERVFEVLDEPEQSPDRTDAPQIAAPKGEVCFEHVQFSYDPDQPLIRDMNFTAKPGQTVAIVGPTGAGKTTLVNLLLRFYELNGGRITVDGVDISQMRRSELRGLFGMVLQDTWLFSGSIGENIAYGNPQADDDEVSDAAKAACADHFIRTLPEGYRTVIREDSGNISQGQRQLLTIARAVLSDPAILILDEATSSVDTRTEVLIQEAMLRLMKGRTSFVIAHRLSTIRGADQILVMNHGDIIEIGSHEELMAKGGFYADLYNSQYTAKSSAEE